MSATIISKAARDHNFRLVAPSPDRQYSLAVDNYRIMYGDWTLDYDPDPRYALATFEALVHDLDFPAMWQRLYRGDVELSVGAGGVAHMSQSCPVGQWVRDVSAAVQNSAL